MSTTLSSPFILRPLTAESVVSLSVYLVEAVAGKPVDVKDAFTGSDQRDTMEEVEYVTGWRFIAIVIAVVLSMFLVLSCLACSSGQYTANR